MLEKPSLADDIIIAALESQHGFTVTALEFMPIGNDARAWAYRVEANTGDYFLKLRKGALSQAPLIVPYYLRSQGISNVVAPLPTTSDQLAARHDDFALILYAYVKGESRWNMALAAKQWRAWGKIMRAIHDAPITAELEPVPREVFAEKWLAMLERIESVIATGAYQGKFADATAKLWLEKAGEIEISRSRYVSLGAQLAARSPQFVLCHADIHTANIIIDGGGTIHIVDWDETVIAPKERDLMFFIGDIRGPETSAAFLEGYGECQVDPVALAYYRYDWVLQEFGDYGERIFLSADLGEKGLALAAREFSRLFAPGDVIKHAHLAYADLSG